ncbi:MAG: hypothetical protein HY763_16280 [Planctomycetes bacterium]|nr:hypothetical protein [Planctomycetota bacterium]
MVRTRRAWGTFWAFTAVAVGLGVPPAPAQPGHSLCLDVEHGCFDFVDATVTLGAGAVPIVGAQFTVHYDPSVLDFVDISPGRECDLASPFTLQVYVDVDEQAGRVFYAVGVNRFVGNPGAVGPATLACLRFIQTGTADTQLCITNEPNPMETLLSDESGFPVPVSNAQDCPTAAPPPALACVYFEVDENCVCTPNTTDCSALTTACQEGVCNADTGRCDIVVINEGGPCDDGNSCTTVDLCAQGACVGRECANPSLCVTADDECKVPEGTGQVTVRMGAGDPFIIGAQVVLSYDPAALQIVSIQPGAFCDPTSPFSQQVIKRIDTVAGRIFYGVAVPFGDPGTQGPATVACITFRVVGMPNGPVCLVTGVNPVLTFFADANGQRVSVDNTEDCADNLPPPALSCDDMCIPVPALSAWGLLVLALALLTAQQVAFGHRQPHAGR